jgi:hypothetical protein
MMPALAIKAFERCDRVAIVNEQGVVMERILGAQLM